MLEQMFNVCQNKAFLCEVTECVSTCIVLMKNILFVQTNVNAVITYLNK